MADIYTKATMNKIYNKLNITSKKNCKAANENTLDFQKCYHQAMATNARNMAIKIRGQVDPACRKEKNTTKCIQKIQSLINYFIQKQETHEGHVEQLEKLEESFLETGRKLICQEMKKLEDNQDAIDYIMNEASKSEVINMISEVCNKSDLIKSHKQILIAGLQFIQG